MVEPSDSPKVVLARVRDELKYYDSDSVLLNSVRALYYRWVRQDTYLVMGEHHPLRGYLGGVAVKAAKRGNDVYHRRVKDRLQVLYDVPDVTFFDYKDTGHVHDTRGFFVTLTYSREGLGVREAWDRVGVDVNRFLAGLRRHYGALGVFRVFEAQKDGFPHVHMLVLLAESSLTAFNYNGAWRVDEKDELAEYWPHGFVDVEALASTRGGLHYMVKYLGKLHELDGGAVVGADTGEGSNLAGLVSHASLTTLACMWVFRKRSFSVGGA